MRNSTQTSESSPPSRDPVGREDPGDVGPQLKVLLLLASNERRGAEIKGVQLARALGRLGHDVEVRCLAEGRHGSRLEVEAFGRCSRSPSTWWRMRRAARRADVVIAYGSTTLAACAIGLVGCATPFVYRSIGDPEQWVRGRIHRLRTGLLLRRSARVVALWPGAADASRRISGMAESRVHAIPNAMDATTRAPSANVEARTARAELGYPENTRIVAVVGALAPEKRVDLAIRAVGSLDDVHLLIAGDGPERKTLERLGRDLLGDRVRFLGSVLDVDAVYLVADVVVLTSSTEGMPGVILEASVMGVPVVSTDVGAVSWMSQQGFARVTVVDPEIGPDQLGAVLDRATDGAGVDVLPYPGPPSWEQVALEWSGVLTEVADAAGNWRGEQSGRIRVLAIMDSTGGGGAELSMAALAPALRSHGVDVEVAYLHDRAGAREQFVADRTPLLHVPPGRTRLHTILRLRRVIRQRRPDLVHTSVFEANVLGRTAATLSGRPVMSSIISEIYGPAYFSEVPSPIKARLAQAVDIFTARLVCRFHAVSETAAAGAVGRLCVARSRIDVIYRGRDMERLARTAPPEDLRMSLGLAPGDKFLLAVGRHEPSKGLDVAIRAMSRLPARCEVKLLIAGREGATTKSLRDLVDATFMGNRVSFLGHRRDVAELMRECDLLVHPSRREGLPGTIIEAMALGTPMVCTDIPPVREVVQLGRADESALFVPVDDASALAAAIQHSLASARADTTRSTMRTRRVFSIDVTSRQHAVLYRQVLRESRWSRVRGRAG